MLSKLVKDAPIRLFRIYSIPRRICYIRVFAACAKLPKCLLKEKLRRCSAYYQQRGEVIMTEIPNCLNKWGKKSPLLSSCHSLLHIHLCTQKIVLIFSFVFPQTVRETKDTGEWSWVRTAPPGEEGRGPGCAKGGLTKYGQGWEQNESQTEPPLPLSVLLCTGSDPQRLPRRRKQCSL